MSRDCWVTYFLARRAYFLQFCVVRTHSINPIPPPTPCFPTLHPYNPRLLPPSAYIFQLRNLQVVQELRPWSVSPSQTTSRPLPVPNEGYCMSSTELLQTKNPELLTVQLVMPGVSIPVMPDTDPEKSMGDDRRKLTNILDGGSSLRSSPMLFSG
eukprot:CAMPEP_0173385690 /NCGR_PEP_ID=MMETSP1356-20130122/8297_1 /TAXON_ID=77927 ORGANISM="Hemiselmis virescens, Strain PCC157" /NCGR_SAMPLE_ID=MMETSP1356 /ASSEMBLY_ACC=CAM_ASM_000847 /LENGTH=154 /DNA_ID=CAMNT_0014341603 /DNA_START=38 /DNA_END=499 /DNA_ORIENTATION=-